MFQMSLIVQKFGGTSVSNLNHLNCREIKLLHVKRERSSSRGFSNGFKHG